ncbi:unnamed protein product [Bursaphelenchus okinawaensis]|uniref:Uncharacterized protein n=1 Tax=Bursaphelenchus okinawaensis TaxID=465554 RepID=A0A811KGS9_9BILA|nr:unnamed protein product [Bursaphelenchus okinawaensis]CAG9102674.1 unnamed protein product [Bursaphelenchus okinawaensis]
MEKECKGDEESATSCTCVASAANSTCGARNRKLGAERHKGAGATKVLDTRFSDKVLKRDATKVFESAATGIQIAMRQNSETR